MTADIQRLRSLADALEAQSAEFGRDGVHPHMQHVLNVLAEHLREAVRFEENVDAVEDGRFANDRPIFPERSYQHG